LKIQMIRKRVEIAFEDGSRTEGFFFVSPTSAHRLGSESMEELLNGDRSYLPLEQGQGEVVLVNKNALVTVLAKEREIETMPFGTKKLAAEVVLRSGETFQGDIYHDLPETHSRLSDYLNRSGRFFHIAAASGDCFVASAFVKLIRTAEARGGPA
jgi:hypothetical protein